MLFVYFLLLLASLKIIIKPILLALLKPKFVLAYQGLWSWLFGYVDKMNKIRLGQLSRIGDGIREWCPGLSEGTMGGRSNQGLDVVMDEWWDQEGFSFVVYGTMGVWGVSEGTIGVVTAGRGDQGGEGFRGPRGLMGEGAMGNCPGLVSRQRQGRVRGPWGSC